MLPKCTRSSAVGEKLSELPHCKAVPGEGGSREPPFDLDTAIRVCRQAGFFEQAAYLAKRWGRHEDYLRVIVEDIGAGSGDAKAAEKADKGKIENGYRVAIGYLREVGGAGVSPHPPFIPQVTVD